MNTTTMKYEMRLTTIGRIVLFIATALARIGILMPRGVMPWLIARCWLMRIDGGPWIGVRLDREGRIA